MGVYVWCVSEFKPYPNESIHVTVAQWFPTIFDRGPLLVCWMAWGATM